LLKKRCRISINVNKIAIWQTLFATKLENLSETTEKYVYSSQGQGMIGSSALPIRPRDSRGKTPTVGGS
jgi:hypothetical protein